ncbi:MAG TPA: FKBP-type peptidyl-prolyl cis-trans isomerase [Pseudolysinimonas sp.]|nr:FKBP-type peptidyl-prolyl cis-trans isomerase [Pseudolysinimonas sp.]
MRRTPLAAVLLVPALVLALAACATDAPAGPDTVGTDGPAACSPSGPVSDAVKVSGDFDTAPTVTFSAPVSVPALQRTVVIKGDGAELQDGALAQIHFTIFNGETGDNLDSTGYEPTSLFQATLDESSLLSGLVKTLRCSTVGSRVVGVVPAADAFGDQGNEQLGVAAGQPVVFVVDVVSVLPTQAQGDSVPLPAGFPDVVWADDGQPTVTIPDADPPADLKVATVITGDGAVVQAGDNVTVQYQGVNWTGGAVFDQSWGRGPTSFTTDGVIAGFGAAMVGQTVGSRVVVIIPPDQGYGPQGGNSGAGIAKDDTLVFVIDILAAQSAG